MANQMRPPKHRLNIGHMTVGIQVRRSINETTAIQMVVFHLPRGANRSLRKPLQAVSTPKTKVMYPMMNIPTGVSNDRLQNIPFYPTWKCGHRD